MLNTPNRDACADTAGDPPVPIGTLAIAEGPPFESPKDPLLAQLHYHTLQRVAITKRQLGLDAATVDKELAWMREKMPTYATGLMLAGAIRCPMYDHAPWVAHYYDSRQLCIALPRLGAEQVRRQVTATFLRRAGRRWIKHFGRHSQIHDRFCILDTFERVVMIGELQSRQRGRRRRRFVHWVPLPDPCTVDGLKQQAAQYAQEASYERGWDNFSTARHLDSLASALRDSAACAQYGMNLTP